MSVVCLKDRKLQTSVYMYVEKKASQTSSQLWNTQEPSQVGTAQEGEYNGVSEFIPGSSRSHPEWRNAKNQCENW